MTPRASRVCCSSMKTGLDRTGSVETRSSAHGLRADILSQDFHISALDRGLGRVYSDGASKRDMARDDDFIVHPDRAQPPRLPAQGFTLLEVLVALAIAIPALLLIYRQGAVSLDLTRSAARYAEAVSRAQSRLDALVDTGLEPRDSEGDEGNDFHWHTRITPITTVQQKSDAGRRSVYAAGTTLYAATVEVSWRGQRGPSRVTLATRLAGPAAERPR